MDEQSVVTLKNVELEFAFAKAMGYPVFGFSRGPFALCSNSSNSLNIFGSDEGDISLSSFKTDLASIPLEVGQELGAILSTHDSVATCRIGDLEVKGDDYLEALMRAIIMYKVARSAE